jgi:hypothetical protein
MKRRMNIYLGEAAWDKLHQQDNMSRYLEDLILNGDGGGGDLVDKLREILQKNKEKKEEIDPNVTNSVMSLLDDI